MCRSSKRSCVGMQFQTINDLDSSLKKSSDTVVIAGSHLSNNSFVGFSGKFPKGLMCSGRILHRIRGAEWLKGNYE